MLFARPRKARQRIITVCTALISAVMFTLGSGTAFATSPSPKYVAPATAIAGTQDAFMLSSLPGADKTLYLDFFGQTLTDSLWNTTSHTTSFVVAPYTIDKNTKNFSKIERDAIRQIWQRVAEDYAPFNINVTTKFPGWDALNRTNENDTQYGTYALITSTESKLAWDNCPCGGLNVSADFDSIGTHEPSLVFSGGYMAVMLDYIENTISHETGHGFGLPHEGFNGAEYYQELGAWAPLMGAATNPVTQWSDGTYAGHTTDPVDEIAIIGAKTGFVADETNIDASTATPMNLAKVSFGLINNRTDTDWFSVKVAKTSNVTFAVAPLLKEGMNLDVTFSIVNAKGKTIATVNRALRVDSAETVLGNGETWKGVLAAGTYYIVVDGIGSKTLTVSYSDYGSVGRYSVSAIVTPK